MRPSLACRPSYEPSGETTIVLLEMEVVLGVDELEMPIIIIIIIIIIIML